VRDEYQLVYKYFDEEKDRDIFKFDYVGSKLKEEKRIMGRFEGLYTFEELPYGCCKFSFVLKVDIKGNMPKVVMENGLSGMIDVVRKAYVHFKRDKEVDELERDAFVRSMFDAPPPTANEHSIMVKSLCHADYRLIGGRVEKTEDVDSYDPNTQTMRDGMRRQDWKRTMVNGSNSDWRIRRYVDEPSERAVQTPAGGVVDPLIPRRGHLHMK